METQSFIPRETKDTLEKETAFKQRIEGYWKVELEKLSSAYSLDFAIVRKGKVASFIELKCRSNMWTKYPTYMISLKKWNMCRQFHASSNLKAFLGVSFTDGDFWLDTQQVRDFEVRMGGRSDRDWTVDREPMVHFSITNFKQWK